MRALLRWGLWAGGCGLVLLGVVTTGRLLLRAGPLQVHGIEVRGLSRTGREALLDGAGLSLGQPLLGVDLSATVRAIEAMPWVARATVRRQLPNRLRIEVEEHVAKAAAMVGELWLVNPDGVPFKRFGSDDNLVLPVITGVHAQPVAERPLALQPAVVDRLQRGLALLDAMLEVRDDLYNVDGLHYDADLGWSCVLLLGRVHAGEHEQRPSATVHLGLDPVSRLPVLLYALARLAERREVPEVIWAGHTHQEGRVQVRLAALPPCPSTPPAPKFIGAGTKRRVAQGQKGQPWHKSRSSSSASTLAPARSAPPLAR